MITTVLIAVMMICALCLFVVRKLSRNITLRSRLLTIVPVSALLLLTMLLAACGNGK